MITKSGIVNRDVLEYIFTLVKRVKKPIVKIYPDGRLVGVDEQFASLNMVMLDEMEYELSIPFIFITKDITKFMREWTNEYKLKSINMYELVLNKEYCGKEDDIISLYNHLELNYNIDELYNKVMISKDYPILYQEDEFQKSVPEMFSLKVSDGAKMYSFGIDKLFLMSSFNAIHPANKTDRVELIIRDYDIYSYTAEFIIHKKKDKYQLHEFIRFRKL